jgi:hypothetical protein
MTANERRFRPTCENLEERNLMSASPVPQSLSGAAQGLTHSSEYYSSLVTQAYQHFLGRTPAAYEVTAWVKVLGSGWTNPQMEAGFVSSPEYLTKYHGPGTDWVTAVYKDLLNRTASSQELTGLAGDLKSGASPRQLAQAVAASPERAGQRIQEDYQLLLHRAASPDEVKALLAQAGQQGESNQDALAQLLTSPEYVQGHGKAYMQQNSYPDLPNGYQLGSDGSAQAGSADSYLQGQGSSAVDWLYGAYHEVLGRTPDVPGLNAWLQALGSADHAYQNQSAP